MLGIPSWVKNSLKHWVHVNALYVVLINVVQSDLRKTQAQYMKNDPNYLSCKKKECKTFQNGKCAEIIKLHYLLSLYFCGLSARSIRMEHLITTVSPSHATM